MNKDEALKLAMDFVASISPAFICEATHHKKNERHADNEPCPHVKKQKQTYEAIKQALANDAIEKKAENARELGLDYEPVAWLTEKRYAQLHTAQRTWVGLTNDELTDLFYNENLGQECAVSQAIALLKERNT